MIRIGTCGFCMRQSDLFRTFAVTEIQQTFYQPPQLKTVERWRREAPDGFEFTLKAFQAITHHGSSPTFRRSKLTSAERAECGMFRDTPTLRAAWEITRALAEALHARYVVFQCPTRFAPTDEHIANLRWFCHWAGRGGLRFGWEPRGREWTTSLVAELCRELDLVHVVDPFYDAPAYGTPRYFRLHGLGIEDYRYTYQHTFSDEELQRLQELCAGAETYCLFNNIPMCQDAQRFQRLVAAR